MKLCLITGNDQETCGPSVAACDIADSAQVWSLASRVETAAIARNCQGLHTVVGKGSKVMDMARAIPVASSRRAADERDELAPLHSITSSARTRIDDGTTRPSALAVLRFRTISNFVGNCTGRSPGFAPCRMRST